MGVSIRRFLAAWMAISCFGVPLFSQELQPGVFGEIIDVRVVNVEVVVTDRDGIRVSGLAAKDFRLEVDGAELPIEYFTEVLGGTAVAPAGGAPRGAGLPQLTPGEPVGTSYLLFIDDFFSTARDRNRVLDAMIEDLPVIGLGDRMAVVAYDGHGLEMLSSWSSSGAELERALKEATRRDAHGLRRLAERRSFEADRQRTSGGPLLGDPTRLGVEEERFAQELASQVQRVVRAGAAALRGFASPPGRKVMLLLSGGWPFNPSEYAIGRFDRIIYDQDVVGGPNLFRPLTDTANRLGYTLYPVDVLGLQGTETNVEFSRPDGVGSSEEVGFLREQNFHAALSYLARETGGRALINAARLDSLPKTLEDTRSYYWLGFTPPWQGDDGHHDIKIGMRDKAYEARSRSGFLDLSRSRQVSNMVESSLLFGDAPSSRPLNVEFGRPKRAGFGKVKLPMKILLPAKEIAILPGKDGYYARIELRIAAINAVGETSDVTVQVLEMARPEAPTEDLLLSFSTEILLRKAKHDLVISVYDPQSGALLAARKTVIPGR